MLNRDPERAGSCCWAIAERGTCPFLNDVYILCQPPRAHVLHNLLEATSQPGEDEGKEQGRHRSGEHRGHQPGSMAASRDQSSWHTDKMSERIAKERELWDAIPTFPDLQCAWQLLLQNANPRANHTMRTLPPSVSRGQCEAHDEGIWSTAKQLMGISCVADAEVQQLAYLPMCMRGLGLRSATRCTGAKFWASWADALPMIRDRTHQIATLVVTI